MTLTDLFQQHGIDCRTQGQHHHATRNWIQTDCPWCSPGWKKFRLGFQPESGRCSCWQCGRRDPIAAIAKLCQVDVNAAIRLWRSISSILPVVADREHDGILKNPDGVSPLQTTHVHYLQRRGFNPSEIVRLWEVQAIGYSKSLRWRLFIPIHDVNGRPVSWTTRSINDDIKHKYITAKPEQEAVHHKRLLYGEQHVQQTVIVVEGPLDAWAIGPGAVATFGVAVTKEQIDRIGQYPQRFVCFDADAQDQADRLCVALSGYPGTTERIELETGSDPASAEKAEILELRRQIALNPWFPTT